MNSLIEQAAQRLAQIRAAGIELPGDVVAQPPSPSVPLATAPAAPAAPIQSPTIALAVDEAPVRSRPVELDLEALATMGIVKPNLPRNQIAEQYRVIKRPLIANATGKGAARIKHGNLIMTTSALPGEGKSFTSINLALSIAAELDHTVMLVDADVARPSILRLLGLPPSPGLLDLLEGKVEMSDVLLRTNVDKLTLLPCGTHHSRATELLASDAMRQLLDDMATRYSDRIIIFDSPPLLLTTEARVLASHMGQIVMVVNANKTLQSDVQHALKAIESCPVRLMLLNKATGTSRGEYGYSYGYGYGYRYGYGGLASDGELQHAPRQA